MWNFEFKTKGGIVRHSSNVFISAVGPFHTPTLDIKNTDKFKGIN